MAKGQRPNHMAMACTMNHPSPKPICHGAGSGCHIHRPAEIPVRPRGTNKRSRAAHVRSSRRRSFMPLRIQAKHSNLVTLANWVRIGGFFAVEPHPARGPNGNKIVSVPGVGRLEEFTNGCRVEFVMRSASGLTGTSEQTQNRHGSTPDRQRISGWYWATVRHMPIDVLIVRHGQSTWNAHGRWQGQSDPPLSPVGERQSAAAREVLTFSFDARVRL